MNMAPVGGATIRPRAPSFKTISMTYFFAINVMRVYLKKHLTHTFLRVCGARFQAQTLCLSPIGRTQFFLLFTAITTDYSLTAISMTTCLGDGFAEDIIL